MAYSGVNPPNNLIAFGGAPSIQELKIETATNMYPGRFVIKGTNDDDIKVADGITQPIGVLGYEQCNPVFKPDSITGIYTVNYMAPVLKGQTYIKSPSGLALGGSATKGDFLISWSDGKVLPAIEVGGRLALKIPFSKNTSEKDTKVKIPAGALVEDVGLLVTTAVASGTVDVGTLSTDSGDADGFLDGESAAAAGYVIHNNVDATAANNTVGALLVEADIKSADTTALYLSVPNGYLVPAGGKTISYTTSDHDIAGFILVFLRGSVKVGQCEASISALSATQDISYKLLI